MSKAFGLVLIVLALYVGMTLQMEGMDNAFGGVFAPIEPLERNSSAAAGATPLAHSADAPAGSDTGSRGTLTERMRNRVSSDMQEGAKRRGY